MNPVRLLLVEDDGVSRGFLTQALQQFPASVDAAADAAHACSLAGLDRYDLLLIDANLPDANGEQLLLKLQSLQPDVTAICLTAEASGSRNASLLAAGFVEIVIKPVSVAVLHATLDRYVSVNRQRNDAGLDEREAIWDDAQGLSALGGNRVALAGLRELFLAELPGQLVEILDAARVGDADHVREQLHRLKASCGFVGCQRLLQGVRALHDAPLGAESLQVFQFAVSETLTARAMTAFDPPAR